ncbi:hypothetical protein ACQZV8_09320 [Magnetococcales bacterium HHB-1]
MKNKIRPVWITLGGLAFRRSFRCRSFDCEGGGRDFAWLTLLLTLLISLTILLVGSRSGLLDRLTDTLLGTLRPHGIPVWVTPHWSNPDGLRTTLLDKLKQESEQNTLTQQEPPFSLHPYRRIDHNGHVQLPSASSWKTDHRLIGWAVYEEDPLWQLHNNDFKQQQSLWHNPQQWWPTLANYPWKEQAQKSVTWLRNTIPALQPYLPEIKKKKVEKLLKKNTTAWRNTPDTIILNAALFQKAFNYEAYRRVLKHQISKQAWQELPELIWADRITEQLKTLWLKIEINNKIQLHSFKIRWLRHIPALDNVAYLFPLATYHKLQAAHHLPELRTQINPDPKKTTALTQFLQQQNYPYQALRTYNHCIENEVNNTGLNNLPKIHQNRCPPPRIPLTVLRHLYHKKNLTSTQFDPLLHDQQGQLWFPCRSLPKNHAMRGSLCGHQTSPQEQETLIPWDVTGYGTPYTTAHIYVKDPTTLSQTIKTILGFTTKSGQSAFNIHPTYQEALNRHDLISKMLTTLIPVYAITVLLLLTTLLIAQIGTLMGHRRNHYGMLLSRGVTWRMIHGKLLYQMSLATFFSTLLSLLIFIPTVKFFLSREFSTITAQYWFLLPPGDTLDVLPLSLTMILTTLGTIYGVVLLITFFLAYRMPLRANTLPSDLLHGGPAPYESNTQQQSIQRKNLKL